MGLEPEQMLSHYRLAEQIGEGGMGVVWNADDTKLGRSVAIKVLPELFSSDPERLARFEREAKLLAALNHPNIAAIHGLDEVDGTRFLVLELVDGENLDQRIRRGALPAEEALDIGRQIAEALEAAHQQGILHRDLKPANVNLQLLRACSRPPILRSGNRDRERFGSGVGSPRGHKVRRISPTAVVNAVSPTYPPGQIASRSSSFGTVRSRCSIR